MEAYHVASEAQLIIHPYNRDVWNTESEAMEALALAELGERNSLTLALALGKIIEHPVVEHSRLLDGRRTARRDIFPRDDATPPATHRREALRSFRTIHTFDCLPMWSQSKGATANPRSNSRLGRGA